MRLLYHPIPRLRQGCIEEKVYGMTIKKKGNVISKCLNNGFIYNNNYLIDLDTFDNEQRNKGYGTLISYKLIYSE